MALITHIDSGTTVVCWLHRLIISIPTTTKLCRPRLPNYYSTLIELSIPLLFWSILQTMSSIFGRARYYFAHRFRRRKIEINLLAVDVWKVATIYQIIDENWPTCQTQSIQFGPIRWLDWKDGHICRFDWSADDQAITNNKNTSDSNNRLGKWLRFILWLRPRRRLINLIRKTERRRKTIGNIIIFFFFRSLKG